MEQEVSTNKEKYEAKKQEKTQVLKPTTRKKSLKNVIVWALGFLVVGSVVSGVIWHVTTQPSTPEPESGIISRNGIHWHSELVIYVKGVRQEVPANIGIGAVHQPVHTHDDDPGIIHMEFAGLVKRQDIRLGQFFKNWDKDIRSFGSNMKMVVNEQESAEYENYIMRDKDKIELHFE